VYFWSVVLCLIFLFNMSTTCWRIGNHRKYAYVVSVASVSLLGLVVCILSFSVGSVFLDLQLQNVLTKCE